MRLFGWFRKKDLKTVLNETKTVKINGVLFKIRKLNPLDHAKGLEVMRAQFDTYRVKSSEPQELTEGQIKKVRKHYRDVFMASVVQPRLSIKDDSELVCVDDIFRDEVMAERLYMEIMFLTYGKKKLMSGYIRGLKLLSSTS